MSKMSNQYYATILRLHASYDAKITKNLTSLVRFAWLFYNQIIFQKFEHTENDA